MLHVENIIPYEGEKDFGYRFTLRLLLNGGSLWISGWRYSLKTGMISPPSSKVGSNYFHLAGIDRSYNKDIKAMILQYLSEGGRGDEVMLAAIEKDIQENK